MANISISQLTAAQKVNDSDLFVLEQNGQAKKLTGSLLLATIEAHGGIAASSYTPPVAPSLEGTLTLTYADGTSSNIPIYNGAKGEDGATGATGANGYSPTATVSKSGSTTTISITDANGTTTATVNDGAAGSPGAAGNPGYCWIKWSPIQPTMDSLMSDTPNNWMGIYSGSSSTAPTSYTAYQWFEVKGERGNTGTNGRDGARGSSYFRSTTRPEQVYGSTHYSVPKLNIVSYIEDNPKRGDILFYGNTYWFFTGTGDSIIWYLQDATTIDSGAIPAGGTTGKVLAKASNDDYDCEWVTQSGGSSIFYAYYGTTTMADINAAILDGSYVVCVADSTDFSMASGSTFYLPLNYDLEGTGAHYFSFTIPLSNSSTTTYLAEVTLENSATVWSHSTSSSAKPQPSGTPQDLGTAARGSSNFYSRADHVHNMPSASDVGAIANPSGGSVGQVLKKTANGAEWANESGGGSVSPYTSNPAALGTASPGSSNDYARGDHVHPLPLKYTTLTIATTDWSSLSCTKTVTGMTSTAIVWLEYSDTTTAFTCTQGTDSLTFGCDATPSAAVTVKVAFMEGISL